MTLRGIFIGIDRFSDPKINDQSGCRRDAIALGALFKDTLADFEDTLFTNEAATTDAIRNAIEAMLIMAEPDDVVILSFSTHGTRDHRIATHDTSLSDLISSTISMEELANAFKKTRAKAVLCILDCCFSGAAPARVIENTPLARSLTSPLDLIHGSGRVLIAASGTNELALEYSQHGLLTYALLEALQAPSATVCIISMMEGVMQRVRAEATRQGHKQNPVLLGYVEGGLTFPSLKKGERFYKAFPECRNRKISSKIEDLATFGIHNTLLDTWQNLFPNGLNELQLLSVNDHGVLGSKSLLVIAPTSSGKTFIGEMATAKAISEGKKAVFLFPYKALTNEKFDYFTQVYGKSLGIRVIRCTGDYLDETAAFIKGKYDLALLTYEMYLNLTGANPSIIDTLGLLVVDEVQFITDPHRGITIELLLTNALTAKRNGLNLQIVALSAVVGHENGFDEWICASKLTTSARPVPLIEGVLDRGGVFQFLGTDGKPQKEQLLSRQEIVMRQEKASAKDVIVPLVKKLLTNNPKERIIIFRNNRGSTEGCANYLAKDCRYPPAIEVIKELPTTDLSSTGETLRLCLHGGIAFHNANLFREERETIERAFRSTDGKLQVLVATTTIAAGVNTPASTVIIAEQQFMGGENRPFTTAEYKNMAGRAGRLGYQEAGKVILLAENTVNSEALFRQYVLGRLEPMRSSFILSEIETWILRLLSQVKRVTKATVINLLSSTYGGYLAAKTNPDWNKHLEPQLNNLLLQMLDFGFIEEEMGYVQLTLLGQACGNSFLSFRSGLRLVKILLSLNSPITAELLMVIIQQFPLDKFQYLDF